MNEYRKENSDFSDVRRAIKKSESEQLRKSRKHLRNRVNDMRHSEQFDDDDSFFADSSFEKFRRK